jgi:hypothetical protein
LQSVAARLAQMLGRMLTVRPQRRRLKAK